MVGKEGDSRRLWVGRPTLLLYSRGGLGGGAEPLPLSAQSAGTGGGLCQARKPSQIAVDFSLSFIYKNL